MSRCVLSIDSYIAFAVRVVDSSEVIVYIHLCSAVMLSIRMIIQFDLVFLKRCAQSSGISVHIPERIIDAAENPRETPVSRDENARLFYIHTRVMCVYIYVTKSLRIALTSRNSSVNVRDHLYTRSL